MQFFFTAIVRSCGGAALLVGLVLFASPFAPSAAAAASWQPNDFITNSIGLKLALIPAGEFVMGSPPEEVGREGDEARHDVRIARPFRIGVTEITQAQWTAVMGKRKCAFEGDDRPVDSISWQDAVTFCEKLSQMEGRRYRLPTEAEWEYACRAGRDGRFSPAEAPNEIAWLDANGGDETHAVATRRANAWGLFDMHGNVAEWCADFYCAEYPKQGAEPPAAGKFRVVRGGSFASFAPGARCGARSSAPESYSLKFIGMRVVLEESASTATP